MDSANLDPLMGEAMTQGNLPSAADPTNAANAAKNAQNASANYNSNSVVSGGSMAALKEQYPDFYKKWIQSVGESICRDMQEFQDRIKKENRKHIT